MWDQVMLGPFLNDSNHSELGSRCPLQILYLCPHHSYSVGIPLHLHLAPFTQCCACLVCTGHCICCALYEAFSQTEEITLKFKCREVSASIYKCKTDNITPLLTTLHWCQSHSEWKPKTLQYQYNPSCQATKLILSPVIHSIVLV